MRRDFHIIRLALGYRHDGSPVIACNGDAPLPAPSTEEYSPSVNCGVLAPHVESADGRSMYDLLGQGFTLLYTTGEDMPAATQAAVPLDHIWPHDPALSAVYSHQLLLSRSDQYIAWIGNWLDAERARPLIALVAGNVTPRATERTLANSY